MEERNEQLNIFDTEQAEQNVQSDKEYTPTVSQPASPPVAIQVKDNALTSFAFYDYYASILAALSDEEAGRMAESMCAYMFTDSADLSLPTDKERYYWGNILDELRMSKESELKGRPSASQNRRMKHFTFYRNFYDALKLMDDRQSGQYVKALCDFMFNNVTPQLKPPVEGFFRLAEHKLILSKIRKRAGKKGGKAERVPVTAEQVKDADPMHGGSIGMEGFLARRPQVKNDIYKNNIHLTQEVDWKMLAEALPYSEYKDCTSLYKILTNKDEIIRSMPWD